MIAYIIFTSVIFLCLLPVRNCKKSQQLFICGFIVLLSTVFSALRGYVGTDTYSYHQIYLDFNVEDRVAMYTRVEPLFALIVDVSNYLGLSSFVFVSLIAVFQGVLLWRVIRNLQRPAEFLALYMAVFYLNSHFNILRQGISVLFMLSAFSFYLVVREANKAGISSRAVFDVGTRKEKEYSRPYSPAKSTLKFYLDSFAALGFHYSSLLFTLPMFFAANRGFFSKLFLVVFSIFFAVACYFVFYDNATIVWKLTNYFNVISEPSKANAGRTLYFVLVIYLMLFVTVLSRGNYKFLTVLFVFWFLLRVLTHYNQIFGRIEIYSSIFFVFYISQVELSGVRRQIRGYLCAFLVVFWGCVRLYSYYNESPFVYDLYGELILIHSPFTPYKFFWEED